MKNKQKKQITSLENLVLDKDERRWEEGLAQGEYVSIGDLKKTKKLFGEAIRNHEELQKSRRITLRVNLADLLRVKAKAIRSGIPYQTLINILIHQYSEGQRRLALE